MTIQKFIKELQKIEKTYKGRRLRVSVRAKDMIDSLNGCFEIVEASKVEIDMIDVCDGDGWTKKHDVVTVLIS